MPATFHMSQNDLEDGSPTYDVYASDEAGQVLIAEPASLQTATELSATLNDITAAFISCGSDRDVVSLATAIERVIRAHAK